MKLRVVLPHQLLLEQDGVNRIVVETKQGSFGILPRRLDCVTPLIPGILIYETKQGEGYLALGTGVMVKAGSNVSVAVRNAIVGTDLKSLRQKVELQLMRVDEQERNVRTALSRLESNFVRRFLELKSYG